MTRRRFLLRGSALALGGAAVAVGVDLATRAGGPGARRVPWVALGPAPAGLPARQHAWTETLARDRFGNPVAPRFDRLIFFDVRGRPAAAHARALEAALRTLERGFRWGPGGLLFTVGWGPHYFRRGLGIVSPVPRARGLSLFELPAIDDYDMCLHLACDDERRLERVEAALRLGAPLVGAAGHLDLRPALAWRETRTGFTGAGSRRPVRTSAGSRRAGPYGARRPCSWASGRRCVATRPVRMR